MYLSFQVEGQKISPTISIAITYRTGKIFAKNSEDLLQNKRNADARPLGFVMNLAGNETRISAL